MSHSLRSFALLTGAFVFFSLVGYGAAFGYDGVLAPSQSAGSSDDVADGYSGAIAPSARPAGKAGKNTKKNAEPLGYRGLVPGYVPEEQAPQAAAKKPVAAGKTVAEQKAQFTPVERPPRETQIYGTNPLKKVRSAEDLKTLAMIHSFDRNGDGIPDSTAKQFKLPPETVAFLEQPRTRVEGMLPMDMMIKRSIDAAMTDVQNKKQSPQQVAENLKTMREGLRAKRSVPDSVYRIMGMPDTYVREEREGLDNALSRISTALKQLGI